MIKLKKKKWSDMIWYDKLNLEENLKWWIEENQQEIIDDLRNFDNTQAIIDSFDNFKQNISDAEQNDHQQIKYLNKQLYKLGVIAHRNNPYPNVDWCWNYII
jgi:hypothetical protein